MSLRDFLEAGEEQGLGCRWAEAHDEHAKRLKMLDTPRARRMAGEQHFLLVAQYAVVDFLDFGWLGPREAKPLRNHVHNAGLDIGVLRDVPLHGAAKVRDIGFAGIVQQA